MIENLPYLHFNLSAIMRLEKAVNPMMQYRIARAMINPTPVCEGDSELSLERITKNLKSLTNYLHAST